MGFIPKEEKLSYLGGKVLVYGVTGTGKSTVAGTWPKANLVDSESGQDFYLMDNENIIGVLPTTSAAEVQETLNELEDEESLKGFDTVIIDSYTKLYENMQNAVYDIAYNRARKQKMKGKDIDLDDVNISIRDWAIIKRLVQRLTNSYIKLSHMGKWIVATAHEKDITKEANGNHIVIGHKPDLPKKGEYDYDIIIRTFTEEDPKTGEVKYFGKIQKDRTGTTKLGEVIENPSFEIWRDKWEKSKKYGAKVRDYSKDVDKDIHKIQEDEDNLEELIETFKEKIQTLEKADQVKVQKKLKELNIGNPLKTQDVDGMKAVVEFMEVL